MAEIILEIRLGKTEKEREKGRKKKNEKGRMRENEKERDK